MVEEDLYLAAELYTLDSGASAFWPITVASALLQHDVDAASEVGDGPTGPNSATFQIDSLWGETSGGLTSEPMIDSCHRSPGW